MNRLVTVANPEGLHMRVALMISECAKKYNATVTITKDSETVSACDVLQVLTLGAAAGVKLRVDAQGEQASEALNGVCALFENNVQTSV
ncbi:MAG: HPr family phosphocarrier protein [Thermoguttaceae bacterium]|nr:HPr family phosphocarrier protein [Thermoguttaceae bacterium]